MAPMAVCVLAFVTWQRSWFTNNSLSVFLGESIVNRSIWKVSKQDKNRVITFLENLEMSGSFAIFREMSGNHQGIVHCLENGYPVKKSVGEEAVGVGAVQVPCVMFFFRFSWDIAASSLYARADCWWDHPLCMCVCMWYCLCSLPPTGAVLGKNIWGAWPLIISEATTAKQNYYRTNYINQ